MFLDNLTHPQQPTRHNNPRPTTPDEMAELNSKTVIVEKINGNVLYNMQDVHYAMFNNKRKHTTDKKTLKYKNNFEMTHRHTSTKLHSKRVFDSIAETTNHLLEKNGLTNYIINASNKRRVTIKFKQSNCFTSHVNKKKLEKSYKEIKDATITMPHCISLIFYVRLDDGIVGGNFSYVKNNTAENYSVINTTEGDVIIYKGNLHYAKGYMHGIGCHDTIKVTIPIHDYSPFTTHLAERVYMNMIDHTARNTASPTGVPSTYPVPGKKWHKLIQGLIEHDGGRLFCDNSGSVYVDLNCVPPTIDGVKSYFADKESTPDYLVMRANMPNGMVMRLNIGVEQVPWKNVEQLSVALYSGKPGALILKGIYY